MTAWQETLDSLSAREQSGKTAQALIGAAEKMQEQNAEALRLMALEYEEKLATMGETLDSAETKFREQRTTLESQAKKIAKLKEPRRSVKVDGEAVEYTYRPGGAELGQRDHSTSAWRMDEIESAIMHLRVAGATDDTIIETTTIKATITDDGQPVTSWSRPGVTPEVTEEDLKRYKWARLRAWSIAGFIGFVIGGWIGMGIV